MNRKNIFLFIILIVILGLWLFAMIDLERDSRNTAKEVCKDMNLTKINQKIIRYDSSNSTRDTHWINIYKVECSDGGIYHYKPYRSVDWNIKDCYNKNKWGECTYIFPERNKWVGYYK